MRCKAFTGDRVQLNRFLVKPDDEILVYDDVAGHFTSCYTLTKAQRSRVIGLANKAIFPKSLI